MEYNQIIPEFKKSINMTKAELNSWLSTEDSKRVGWKGNHGGESKGHESGRMIAEILGKKKEEYTEEDYEEMERVVGYIKRHMAQKPEKEELATSNWRYSLMNWGHDPLK